MRGLLGLAGLVGLLITVAIMFYIWTEYNAPVAKAAKKAQQQTNQIAGLNSAGVRGGALTTFAPVERNGSLTGLTIVTIDPTDALAEHFGLIPGDVVMSMGPLKMGESIISDFDSAKEEIVEAMQRKWDIVVNRGGTEITLPKQRNFSPGAVAPIPGSSGGTTGGAQ